MPTIEERRAYARKWYYANKEKHRQAQKRYHDTHREELRLRQAPKKRNRNLQANYGISSQDYDQLLFNQKNLCAICGKLSNKRLHVDHNHQTKEVRGLLCNNCNRGLGFYRDSIEILTKAIQYLSKHG